MKTFKFIIFIFSAAVIILLLFFLIGEGFYFWEFTKEELVASLFFPFGFLAGLIVGFKKQRIGGYISVFSIIGFFLINFLAAGKIPSGIFFFIITIPGILLLLYPILEEYKERKNKK